MHERKLIFLTLVTAVVANTVPAYGDAISPRINNGGHTYSKETPNVSFYGNGISGRLSEASALRFEGERDTQDGNFDSACKKLSKAVQLDPADPSSHLLLARALQANAGTKNADKALAMYQKAILEWRLIWHHDADPLEQIEAKWQVRKLSHLCKKIEKQMKQGNMNPVVAASRDEDTF